MIHIISILGKTGSGKSTISKRLAEELGYDYISTGEIARQMAEEDPLTDDFLNAGMMAPEYEMRARVTQALSKVGLGVVLDGMPRKPEQVGFLYNITHSITFVLLNIPDEVVTRRLLARGREDDQPHIIQHRLLVYNNSIKRIEKNAAVLDVPMFILDGQESEWKIIEAIRSAL